VIAELRAPPIPAAILAAVRGLELRARRAVREGLGGRWTSAVRGAGLEFAEVRDYVPGDDARTLDWNVSARTGRLHVKRFDEEREQTVFFLVDGSRSCRARGGARPWPDVAAEVMALLGLAAAEAGDRTGAVFFSEGVEEVIAPRHGSTAVLSLLARFLARTPKREGTDLDASLREFLRLRVRPCLAIVLTDLHDLPSDVTLRAVARRHDLVVVALRPGWFDELPPRGLLRVEHPEQRRRFLLDLFGASKRAELSRRIASERADASQRIRRAGAELVELSVERPVLLPIAAWAARRALERER